MMRERDKLSPAENVIIFEFISVKDAKIIFGNTYNEEGSKLAGSTLLHRNVFASYTQKEHVIINSN